MVNLSLILFLAGALVGLLLFFLPQLLWLKEYERVDASKLKERYPKKKWLVPLFQYAPVLWIILAAFLILPAMLEVLPAHPLQSYFLTFMVFAGFGVVDGLLEVITGISPVRRHAGSLLYLKYFILDDVVRKFGLIRIGLTLVISALSFLALSVIR